MVVTLLERLDRQGVGVNGQDAVDKRESTLSGAVFVSVVSAPLHRILHRISSSALKQIEGKLQEVSDRVKNVDYAKNNEDSKAVSELMECIRDAVIDCQVSDGTQVEPAI